MKVTPRELAECVGRIDLGAGTSRRSTLVLKSHRIATMRVFAAYLNEFELTLRHSFEWPGGGAMP
jgi:hypothetical protein